MKNNTTKNPKIGVFLIGGLIAGLIAAVINNIWLLMYPSATGKSVAEIINIGSVSASSIVALVVGGIVYFTLTRFTKKGNLIFIIVAGVFTLFSLLGPMNSSLPDGNPVPDGFALLTIPMHIIAGLSAILIIPRWIDRKK